MCSRRQVCGRLSTRKFRGLDRHIRISSATAASAEMLAPATVRPAAVRPISSPHLFNVIVVVSGRCSLPPRPETVPLVYPGDCDRKHAAPANDRT
jgi:hypothetical protein